MTERVPRIVLVGEVRTAEFALRGLLRAGVRPILLVTTDIAAVRARSGMAAEYYCDLSALGASGNIPVRITADLHAEAAMLAALAPDYMVIMGWPYIVRDAILDVAPCIGMHPSMLPRRRGGAPVNWAILDGEPSAAVSLIRLRPGIDNGEILAQRAVPIGATDYIADVGERVYALTEELMAESATLLAAGRATWTTQDETLATYTRRRRPDDGRIRWNDSAVRIRNLVRAVSRPFPGAFTQLGASKAIIWRAELPLGYRAPLKAEPGAIVGATDDGLLVSTRDNALLITELEVEGKPSVAGSALRAAFSHAVGTTLE